MSLMPFVKLSALERCALLTTSIIISPFSHQPFFYFKYTKANTCLSYDVRSVPPNKYIFLYYYTRFCIYYNFLVP